MDRNEYIKMSEVEDRMWYFHSLHAHVGRELERAGLKSGAEILDAGCGTGGLIDRARKWPLPASWTGIDLMPLACELAQKRFGAAVEIREASVTALPFEAERFDAVVSVDVVCQVENAADAAAEFMRVLRPGGLLVLNVPAYMWMWSYHDDAVHTKHRYTRPEIATLLHGAGFSIERLTHWNALPFPLIWAKRKIFRTNGETSDVKPYPAAVEAMFRGLMTIEHAWMRGGGQWAWGTSVFAVARKP
ncbi:MAG: methyltransferase domain-containing protein [Opitutaceae bacterium]|nr:methyltransferase domain-containing protein [Opitutaceae bacterium]